MNKNDLLVMSSSECTQASPDGEAVDGVLYSKNPRRKDNPQSSHGTAYWLGAYNKPIEGTAKEVEALRRGHRVRALRAGTLERLVENLLWAFEENDSTYVTIFLATYRTFATAEQVLRLLCLRYEKLQASGSRADGKRLGIEPDEEQPRSCLPSILGAWLDHYPEDFRDPPDYPALRSLLELANYALPNSDVERRAVALLCYLRKLETPEAEAYKSSLLAPFPTGLEGKAGPDPDAADFPNFPADLVASQFTLMDAELFKRVVPYHCLGSVWSRRDCQPPPSDSVRATVVQFNSVAACVVTSVMRPSLTKTSQRARVLQRWIDVARECRLLKNFSSLRAVLSALQSNPLYRLKRTWTILPRDSITLYEELSAIFSEENNHLTSRELLMKEATSKFATLDSLGKENPRKAQKRLQKDTAHGVVQGTVPYLGTFLTDLTMLDTALPNYVENGLINFEKRRREFEVMAQIKLLQSACNSYTIRPHRPFLAWFHKLPRLTEEESYSLSKELEPPLDSALSPRQKKKIVRRFSGVRRTQSGRAGNTAGELAGPEATRLTLPVCKAAISVPEICLQLDMDGTGILRKTEGTFPKTLGLKRSHKRSGSDVVPGTSPGTSPASSPATLTAHPPGPAYNRQADDECIIRVSLDFPTGNLYKSLLLKSQDKTEVVVKRALSKHNMDLEKPDDFLLVQLIGERKEFVIPKGAYVYYAMVSSAAYDFLLRRHSTSAFKPSWAFDKGHDYQSATFPRARSPSRLVERLTKLTM
uniref:ral guanine nucleotide dissociation stimulator-like 1 isoform X2 n=1 Tax=Myxine glutinosa TaxID=7769 RepID=UPI00358F4BCE